MLRAGATVGELAAHYDMDRDRLDVYATPIVAERDWIARQAQELEVAAPQLGNHAYEAVFGDEPALLGEMVTHRLEAMGLDPESVQWDAWREADSTLWTILPTSPFRASVIHRLAIHPQPCGPISCNLSIWRMPTAGHKSSANLDPPTLRLLPHRLEIVCRPWQMPHLILNQMHLRKRLTRIPVTKLMKSC